jgi:hypothetical protein
MLKLGELKAGDIIMVNDDGVWREGIVVELSNEMHEALVDNGIQEFWYTQDEMKPVALNEEQLLKLGFEKQVTGENAVKYSKGAFRLVTLTPGDFSNIEMWYREDRRHFNVPIGVHQLQNLHLAMTKVPLEMPA